MAQKYTYLNNKMMVIKQIFGKQVATLIGFSRYIIHEDGFVYDLEKRRMKKIQGKGYKKVVLTDDNGEDHICYLHHLIARCFIGEIPEGYDVNHIDEDTSNNARSNLEIVTHKENCLHGSRNMKISQATMGKSKVKRQYKVRKNGEVIIYDSLAELCRNHPSQSKTTWHYRNNIGQINDREFSAVEDDEVIYISVLVGREMKQGELKF